MADVASRVGVSHQTVSRVLNGSPLVREETRQRVLEAIETLGYRRNSAARVLATNRSGRIGLVVDNLALFGPSTLADAVLEAGREAGYEVSLVGLTDFSPRHLNEAVGRLLDQAVEAIVIAAAQRVARETTLALQLPIPIVLAQGVAVGDPMAAGVDQEAGARMATDHLLDLGHEAVAHLTGPSDWVEAAQREAGWRTAHAQRNLRAGLLLQGDWSPESGYLAGRLLADRREVTAVFAANDSMALGLLKAVHERGMRVPGDISVVGFDDVPEAAYFWPALTTVRQDFRTLGRNALQLAVRALDGEDRPDIELVAPVLVVRESTGLPPDWLPRRR